jgi:pyruvate kinase
MGAMTDKDRSDLEYAVRLGVDWIALSFVQRVEDVAEAKKIVRLTASAMPSGGGSALAAIMSKIEKPSALRELEQIIDQSDGIMIARGDLGVELPVEQVPGLQKAITRAARNAGKPVVVATQMLESMITSPVPTRAEVSDVATAVFEGADAVMLSAESAAGDYPVEAVRTLDKVAVEVERDPLYDSIIHAQRAAPDGEAASALTAAACSVAHDMGLACIVCYTSTGATALRAARQRPRTPILVLTPKTETARRLAVVWGLHCVHTKDPKTTAEMVERSGRIAQDLKFGTASDKMIIAAGLPFGTPGATNMLRIACLGEERPRK